MTMTPDERARDIEVRRDVTALVGRLRTTWPEGSLKEVEDDLAYGQWSEVVSNVVALNRREGHPLNAGEQATIDGLVEVMGMRDEVEATIRHVERSKAAKV